MGVWKLVPRKNFGGNALWNVGKYPSVKRICIAFLIDLYDEKEKLDP